MANREDRKGKAGAGNEGGKEASGGGLSAGHQSEPVPIWYQPESGVPREPEEQPGRPLSEDD